MTARGIRNNNPGNIRYVAGITSTYLGCTGTDGAFCVFDTAEHGLLALCRLLLSYQDRHGLNTVAGIINRWAPPTENETSAYVTAASAALGVGQDAGIDLHDPHRLTQLAGAIVQHENGEQPYAAQQITDAADSALGLPPAFGEAPQPTQSAPTPTAAPTPQGAPVPFLALLPLIAQFIPQIMTLIKPNSVSTAKDAAVAGTILNTVVQAAGILNPDGTQAPVNAASVGQAAEKMAADPVLAKQVQTAVITHPEIMPVLEIGGGIAAARVANAPVIDAPWWSGFSQPVFVFGLILCGMVIMILGNVLGMPWGGSFQSWSSEVRASVISAVIAGGLGAITGYWFGTTQQSGRKDTVIAQQAGAPVSPSA